MKAEKERIFGWGGRVAAGALLLAAVVGAPGAQAAAPAPITIVVFSKPSLGAFLPNVIKERKLDLANGLDITFAARTPDAYTAQFNSGEFALGGSAALLTIGIADERGVKAAYLFNLFDYFGAVVTQQPGIKTIADLRGKQLAAAHGTTNYAMFEWLAKQQGVDPTSFSVINTATPGLISYAIANRADAVQLWEPAYSLLIARKPDIRTIDLHIASTWRKAGGGEHIPYLGVAAHLDWIAKHPTLIAPLYRTYQAAAQWAAANPDAAAPLIAGPKATAKDRQAIAQLVRDNKRLGMDVAPAAKLATGIKTVYHALMSVGLLTKQPSDSTIYEGKLD